MTFPVDYPNEVKGKILASFKRGLLRSFPESLIKQPEFSEEFLVEERACEPAAYAACALPSLKIEPTTEGVAYAVFDFGGGTTDFDFGFYRAATMEEEDDEGVTEVLERFKPNGDRYLGGENILENMAYIVFTENEKLCRDNAISFTCPPDAIPIPGAELLIDNTQLATTNMVMLVSLLRDLWEKGIENQDDDYTKKIEFLSRNGGKISSEMIIPIGKLKNYLNNRIGQGVESFMAAISEAFKGGMPKEIHILLAGNSSRTSWVQYQFDLNTNGSDDIASFSERVQRYFGANAPQFIVHAPLEGDENDFYKPNAKTGVALGLLHRLDLKN